MKVEKVSGTEYKKSLKPVSKSNLKFQRNVIIVVFLAVPMLLALLFSYYPAVKLIQQSFTDWDGGLGGYHYIGLQNYKDVLSDPEIMGVFKNTLAYLIVMALQTCLGLYLAIILNSAIKGKNFFKSIIFMPYILNGVAVAFMFNYIYDFNSGPINVILRNLGLGDFAIRFLDAKYSINFSLAFIGMWRFTGLAMIIFLAALQSIGNEIYEAASIDGANFFQTVFFITMPNIKRVIELNLFLGINGALQAFFEPFIITHGGPAGMSDTFVTKAIKIAFDFNNFGKASAMSAMLMLIILIIVSIQRLALRGDE